MNIFQKAKNFFTKMVGVPTRGSVTYLQGAKEGMRIDKSVFVELYIRNGDIRGSVSKIAKKAGVNGLYIQDKNGNAILDKSLEKIFSTPTWQDFKLELIKYSMIQGEVFIVPVMNGLQQTVSFRFLDPRTIVKYYDRATGELTGFVQHPTDRQGQPIVFTLDEIAYFQYEKHPNNDFDGLSVLESVVYDAMSDKSAMERNFSFIENNNMPDGFVILDKELPKEELEVAKHKIDQELSGKANVRKILTNSVVKDIKTLGLSPREIDFIAQRKLTVEKICAIFGVPKSILGYVEDVNKSNGETQRKTFLDDTVRPAEKYIEYILNTLYDKFVSKEVLAKGQEIKLDGESSDDRVIIETGQREDVKLGIASIDEVRQERGKKLWNIKNSKIPLIQSGIAPLDKVGEQ